MAKERVKNKISKKGKITIKQQITELFEGRKETLTTRQILDLINKQRKPKDRVSIHGVRVAVKNLLKDKVLIVSYRKPRRQFLLKEGNIKTA